MEMTSPQVIGTQKLWVSGFSDEISANFTEQLTTVKALGMSYISLRSVDGKNIGDFTVQEVEEDVKPKLAEYHIAVSSIGSPIGKVFINDDEGFLKQKTMLKELCEISQLLECRYIRIFSFYIPEGHEPQQYEEQVIDKLRVFVDIAKQYDIVLLHENEKDIFGDTAARCKAMFRAIDSKYFKAIFDFANFVQCGEDTAQCYELLREDVVYIHIKDAVTTSSHNVVCGSGEGKIPQLLQQFIESGYEGFLTLEPHLVMFDSLKTLEIGEVDTVIQNDQNLTGAQGYEKQYKALQAILKNMTTQEVF